MIDNSYYILLNRLKAFANGHYLINTFTYHEIANFDITKNPHYPIMHAVPLSMNPSKGAIDYSFEITFADWVRAKEEKQENEVTVISDLHRCALDLCTEITNGNILFGDEVTIQGDAIITPFIDEFANTLSGVTLQITIRIPYDWSACDIPANWVDGTGDIPDFGGRSLTMDIYDEGNFVVAAREMNFVGSGVTVTYSGNRAIVTITGGGGGGGLTCDDLADCDTIKTIQQSVIDAEAGANTYTDNQINALTAADVGLGNVNNTSDLNKPISTATQTALDTKEPTIAAGTTAQYWRGDKSWQTLDKSAVGLSNVDNTSDADKPISAATQAVLDLKANVTQLPLSYSDTTDSAAVTGTTTVTKLRSQLIPANTFAVGDIIRVRWRDRKTGTAGNATHSLYVHTSDSVTGASLLGFFTQTATRLSFQGKRDLVIKSATVTEVADNGTSLVTDDADIQTAFDNINIDWTVDQYIIFAVNPANAGDSMRNSSYIIERL